LVVILGLLAAVGVHLKLTYDKAVRDAETLITALSIASEQHIGASLAGIDALLDELAATVRDGRQRDPQFSRDFAARLPSFPEIRYIGVVDADGNLQPETWPADAIATTGVNVTDRRYFTAQRTATGAARMVVGDPVVGHASNERTLHLSRPVHDKAGRFAGVVVAAVNPDIYAAFLSSILYDAAGSCGLISEDGRVIARAPNHASEFGRDISDSDLIRIWTPRSPMAVAHLVAKVDGNDKMLAYRVMPEFSLMVTAGVSKARALGEWRRMALAELVLLSVFATALLYWAALIRRHDHVLDHQQHLMEEAVFERSRALEVARTLAEERATRLSWINDELKRLTLVTSHHLQEPLRAIVSCGQMIPRALGDCPQALRQAVEELTRQGLEVKSRLGIFEQHMAAMTSAMLQAEHPATGERAPESDAPSEPPPNKAEKPVYTARTIAGTIAVALLGGCAWQVRSDYQVSLQAAETLTSAVVNSIERHLQGSFRRIDNLLDDVALAINEDRHTRGEFRDRLLSRLATVAEIRQLSVADANGEATPWSWSIDNSPVQLGSVADRDFFLTQRTAKQRGLLVVGQPTRDAGNNRLLHLSRPLIGPGGRFQGVVVASVETDLYAHFLDSVLLDEDGASAVLTTSGRMVARAPKHEEKFGIDVSTSDLFTRYLPKAPSGIAHLVSKADGNHKLLGYRMIETFPLVVTSGYSYGKALAHWKGLAAVTSTLALFSAAVLFAWAWRADRQAGTLARYRGILAGEVARRTAGLTAAHMAAEQRSLRLAEANGRMQELIRIIAADMQAPLRDLSERIKAVETMAAGSNQECDHWLGFITDGGIHLRALLRDYQRFVAALTDAPRRRPLDLNEIVRGAAGLVRGMWDERIVFDIAPLPTLPADRDMLLELFLQLFANAAIHGGGTGPVTVIVTAEAEADGNWRLSVADNGPGLPPVNGDQLFRAFETAHDRDPDSTGLGLPLCRVIVQSHGGRIWATSRPGKGCTIHISLPARTDGRFPLAGNPATA
jgi:signal transduction histidine kinase